MTEIDQSRLKPLLQELTEAIRAFIANHPGLKPQADFRYKMVYEKFEHTPTGLVLGQGQGEPYVHNDWKRAMVEVYKYLLPTETYLNLGQVLNVYASKSLSVEFTLQRLIFYVAELILRNRREISESVIHEIIDRFIQQLETKTVNVHIYVPLNGISIQSSVIQINDQIVLRQSKKEDLHEPAPEVAFVINRHTINDPTAILDIRLPSIIGEPNSFQELIKHSIDILNLFCNGGIAAIYTAITSDSLLSNHGGQGSGGYNNPDTQDMYYLDNTKESKLIEFFGFMEKSMPAFSARNREVTSLSVAFDRYMDANTERKYFERKVMNAIMGLEALFLNEKTELAYKLSMRCSKVMLYCGKNPLDVKEIFKAGYNIRSTFAHGDHVSKKDLNKYDTKFGDHKNIAKSLCEYLRIAICSFIILDLKKDKLIEDVDTSLLVNNISVKLTQDFLLLYNYIL